MGKSSYTLEQLSVARRELPKEKPFLSNRIIELATRYGRYGYRRITALLKREG